MAFDKKKRRLLAHILAAFIILIHGYDKWEKGESSYWVFLLFGLLFLLLVFFHKRLAARFPWIDGVFHGIEALLMFITAYDYFAHGKTALPASYVVAGIGYTIAAIFVTHKNIKQPGAAH